MRIAILAAFPRHVIPGQDEGAPKGHFATWLPQLAEAFAAQQEFEIHWITVTREPVTHSPVQWQNQTFHFLHAPGRLRLLHAYRRERLLIGETLRRLQPELVHAWGTEHCYALAGAECGRPWLLSMQGILLEYLRRQRMAALVYVQAVYEWLALRRATQISVESHWGAAVMRRQAPKANLHLVEYGVQPLFYATPWQPSADRKQAIFIGSAEPRKGLRDAIRAFASQSLRDCELVVVGDCATRAMRRLRAMATPNVTWRGRLTPEETARAMAQAWCLVLPTRADTSPNVVKEARVLGLPVVTTPHGGQSDYIANGVNGFLVDPEDVAGLARAVATVTESLAVAQRMGAERWAEQREHFRPENTARGFLELYRKLTA